MTDYSKIKELIRNADAIIIGAGAGLSTSAGINYGEKDFPKLFPELVEKYHPENKKVYEEENLDKLKC